MKKHILALFTIIIAAMILSMWWGFGTNDPDQTNGATFLTKLFTSIGLIALISASWLLERKTKKIRESKIRPKRRNKKRKSD